MTRSRALPALLMSALLACAACSSPTAKATDSATEAVRSEASALRLRLQDELRLAPGVAAEMVRSKLVALAEPNVRSSRVDGEAVELEKLFHHQGESGGGLNSATVGVALCVRFRGVPGKADLAMTDADCGITPTTFVPGIGNIHKVVRL